MRSCRISSGGYWRILSHVCNGQHRARPLPVLTDTECNQVAHNNGKPFRPAIFGTVTAKFTKRTQ